MNIGELRKLMIEQLEQVYDTGEAEAISSFYLEDKLGIYFSSLEAHASDTVGPEVVEGAYKDLIALIEGKPLQYLLGYQWFAGRKFMVNESVLIPRPETEELVELVISETNGSSGRFLDIGTGSGCIAVSVKLMNPLADVTGTDISGKALEVARNNADLLKAPVAFLQDDIVNTSIWSGEIFDVIISNPPYIPLDERDLLNPNVIKYEPGTALFAPEHDALYYYRAIAEFGVSHLAKGGKLYLEIHYDMGEKVSDLLYSSEFQQIRLLKDMSGNERFVCAIRD